MPEELPPEWVEGDNYQRLLYFQRKLNKRRPRSEVRFERHLKKSLKGLNLTYLIETNKILFSTKTQACPTRGKGYLVDFYLPRLKLGLEVDGSSHESENAKVYDAVRDSFIATHGIKIVRFQNSETLNNDCVGKISKVIEQRRDTIKQRKEAYKGSYSKAQPLSHKAIERYIKAGGKITICPPALKKHPNSRKGIATAVKVKR